MSDTKDDAIVVKKQNFNTALRSIKVFSDTAQELTPLNRVPNSGGFLNLGNHKVTGTELNEIVSQVQGQLINLRSFDLGIVDLITNIYKALDALDREYIAGILAAANAAKAANDKVTEETIKNVESIQKIIEVLKKFKNDLENLEHLMDADKAWQRLDEQNQLLKGLKKYQDELSTLVHLKDVDTIWSNQNSQAQSLENITKRLDGIDRTLKTQEDSIVNFADIVKDISEGQKSFIDSANQRLDAYQADIDIRFNNREKAMQEEFHSLSETISKSQVNIVEKIDDFSKVQSDRLHQFEQFQADRLNQISKEQTDSLDQIASEQVKKLEAINQSLEEEKSALSETVSALTQKFKTACILAGGTAFIATIHLILNMIGIM